MNWYMLQFPPLPVPIPGVPQHTMFYAETSVFLMVQLALKSGITLPGGIPLTGIKLYEYSPTGWQLIMTL